MSLDCGFFSSMSQPSASHIQAVGKGDLASLPVCTFPGYNQGLGAGAPNDGLGRIADDGPGFTNSPTILIKGFTSRACLTCLDRKWCHFSVFRFPARPERFGYTTWE